MSAFVRVSFATPNATPAIRSRKISCAADARSVDLADTAFSVRGDRNRLRLVKPKHQKVSSCNSCFFLYVYLLRPSPKTSFMPTLGAREQWTTVPLKRLRDRNYSVFFRRNQSHGSRRPKNETRVRSADQQYRHVPPSWFSQSLTRVTNTITIDATRISTKTKNGLIYLRFSITRIF